MKNYTSNELKYLVIILFIIGEGFFFFSCTTFGIDKKPVLFRSEEYVIYRLKKRKTPAMLAEMFLGDAKRSWVIEDANENVAFKKGEVIVIPLKEKNKGGLADDGFQVVPILSYHRFADNCDSSLCLPACIFDQQMKYLKENGYRVISLEELLEFLKYRNSLPKRSVVISIDDGYRSVYNIAWPILKKYGFRATFFIYTNFVGVSKNAITWDQLREMKKSGFEIGAHTISHCDLTRQNKGEDTQAYMSRIEKELSMSKQIIDKKLNQNTVFLAFPYGRYNQRVLDMCKRLGYTIAVSVKRGSNPFFADPLALRRNQILKRDIKSFISKLKTFNLN
ncbi:MAG: polysaccharide deacetylase family protein [Desulfobacteraceae bacterium]|nr:polysaccharide deacetylase family protein [Desulfobacteraceae bacterium]MBC2719659.1 polysaccharide deacetylase family protein [Desulfobacteraceae bacterium]